MPQLANPSHEAFARARAQGFNKTHAAIQAGGKDTAAHNLGSRLDKRPEIAERIAHLRSDRSVVPDAKVAGSKNWSVNELVRTYRFARKKEQYSVCVQAILAIAKLQGHLVEQRVSYSEQHRTVTTSADVVRALREQVASMTPAEQQRYMLDAPAEVRQALDVPSEVVQQTND